MKLLTLSPTQWHTKGIAKGAPSSGRWAWLCLQLSTEKHTYWCDYIYEVMTITEDNFVMGGTKSLWALAAKRPWYVTGQILGPSGPVLCSSSKVSGRYFFFTQPRDEARDWVQNSQNAKQVSWHGALHSPPLPPAVQYCATAALQGLNLGFFPNLPKKRGGTFASNCEIAKAVHKNAPEDTQQRKVNQAN